MQDPVQAVAAFFPKGEAVTQVPAPAPAPTGMVIDVVQTGYKLNGKVLRYAKVVVGA